MKAPCCIVLLLATASCDAADETQTLSKPKPAADSAFHPEVIVPVIEALLTGIDADIKLKEKDIESLGKDNFGTFIARSIVALGEFSESNPRVIDLLDKISNNPEYDKIHAPDWVMFVDEYEHSLKRMGRKLEVAGSVIEGETEHESMLGIGSGRSFARLAKEAKSRILRRPPNPSPH